MRRVLLIATAFLGSATPPAEARQSLRQLARRIERSRGGERSLVLRAIGSCPAKDRAAEVLLGVFDIRNGSPEDSRAIVESLGRLGHARGAEPLIDAWEYLLALRFRMAGLPGHLQVLRAELVEALGRIGDPRALPVLRRGLIDEDPLVVQRAAEAVGRLKDAESVDELLRRLKAGNRDIAQSAFEALGDLGGERVEAALREELKSEENAVRVQAAYALARMKVQLGFVLLDGFIEEEAEPYPEGILAAYYLGRVGRENGVAYLSAVALDPQAPLRPLAVEALGKSRAASAVRPLAELAKAEEAAVRILAAAALGRLEGMRARHALKPLAKDPDERVRAAARSALAGLGDYDPL